MEHATHAQTNAQQADKSNVMAQAFQKLAAIGILTRAWNGLGKAVLMGVTLQLASVIARAQANAFQAEQNNAKTHKQWEPAENGTTMDA